MTILRRRDERHASRWVVYDRHVGAIRAYAARRVERDAVDDVVAETFAIAWRRLPREGDPLPWLYGVARKVVHGHRRSHARRGALLERVAGSDAAHAVAPDHAEQLPGDPALARAFALLTEQEREAIRLVAWECLEHGDAARAAGCSRATFAVRLSRARQRLRRALDEPAPPPVAPAPVPAPAAPAPAPAAPVPAPAAVAPAAPVPARTPTRPPAPATTPPTLEAAR